MIAPFFLLFPPIFLGKNLCFKISLFLAAVKNVSLISIQVMAIISHQIDSSFIYVSCLFLQRAIRSDCPAFCCSWQDLRIYFYDGPGGVAFLPGDWMAAKCNEILFVPLEKWIFLLLLFQVLIKCKLEGCTIFSADSRNCQLWISGIYTYIYRC